jgi:hypothetical protein
VAVAVPVVLLAVAQVDIFTIQGQLSLLEL